MKKKQEELHELLNLNEGDWLTEARKRRQKQDSTNPVKGSSNSGRIETQWACKEERDMFDFHELVPEMAINYGFELDRFQKEAVFHLERGGS